MSRYIDSLVSLLRLFCFSILIIFSPVIALWNTIALGIWVSFGSYLHMTENGLKVQARLKSNQRLILWQDIKSLNKVYRPPFFTYKIVLATDENITVDFLSDDFALSELEKLGVTYIDERA